jgi:uncharacterized repeat protein (TIGR04138 family)
MQAVNFEGVVARIAAGDKRYQPDAYVFVREALDHTQKKYIKSRASTVCHVTGPELLAGLREYALQQFGPMAITVLDEWGVRCCEDFGELVFNMIENGLLAKTDKDSRADFKNGYLFEEAFRQPFLPTARKPAAAPETKPA